MGKGNHSDGKVPKIKPAVEELCRSLKLQVSQEQNAGRLYISISKPAIKPEVPVPTVPKPKIHKPLVPEYSHQSPLHQKQNQQHIPSMSSGYVAPGYTVPTYVAPVQQSTYSYGTAVPQASKPILQQPVRPPTYTPPRPPQNSYAQDLEAGKVDDVPQVVRAVKTLLAERE